jgi:predicted TIM-barrel fold metal-dependent hydrolase
MDAQLASMPVIDVDTHFTEPPDLWTSRAPQKLKDRAPRVVRDANGRDQWVVDDDLVFGPMGYCVIRKNAEKQYGTLCLDTFDELHPGASQARPRLALMDEHGLTFQILYPNILGFAGNNIMRLEDHELRNFCITTYNDACAELAAESDGRLYPMMLLPFWDIELAVKELARGHEELGLHGFVLTDGPETWGLPTLSQPYWDPLWSAAQERGLPCNFHIGGGGGGTPSAWNGVDMDDPACIATLSTQAFLGNQRCITNLIFSGLLDRFPSLDFVSVESGIGWIPFLLDLCEYQFDENGITSLELRPKQYFERQIYASYWFEGDAATPIAKLGEDNVMFETDFPHPTCLYPGVKQHVQDTLGGLDPRVQRKILYETAERVYNLKVSG